MRTISLLKLLIFSIIVASSVFCSKEKPPEFVESTDRVPDQEMWDSYLKSTKNGLLEAVVNFGHMIRFQGDDILKLDQGIRVNFYDEKGEHTSTLTSMEGEFNEKTRDVRAVGNVVVVSDTGVTLYTEQLAFDSKTEKVVSNVDVMVTTADGDTLYGTSFISNTAFTDWQITNTRGVSHSGVDLSVERWKKQSRPDSLAASRNDSLFVSPDSIEESVPNDSV